MKHGLALALLFCVPQDSVQEQVERLGSDETEVREKAAAELLKLGEAAIPALERATKHADAEIRGRAQELLKRLAREALRGTKLFDARAAGKPDEAVRAALGWLARHQNADGSWSVTTYVKRCKKACEPNPGHAEYDGAMTGLALLAFLGAGHTQQSKELLDGATAGDVVRRGFESLIKQQGRDGGLTSDRGMRYMYGHSVCALALAEACGMRCAEVCGEPLEKAVGCALAAQNPGKGWRYSSKCGDNDTSVTFWAALRKALLPHQRAKDAGCAAGSWEPVDRWGGEGGRVYATAINAMTLETTTRYRVVPGR